MPRNVGFLLLHGWRNHRPPQHWQHWLARDLSAAGHVVRYPQLPEPDEPVLGDWLAALDDELAALGGTAERVVLAHSLGVLLWLAAARAGRVAKPVDRLLLVAPPSASVARSHPEIAGFVEALDPQSLQASARSIRLVASDADPYAPEGAERVYGWPLGLDTDVVFGGVHLNHDAGYGPWPSLRAWCDDPTVRLTPRPTDAAID